jgi:SOS-response transcriptional repressor LexA
VSLDESQASFSRALGVDISSLQKWEQGQRDLPIAALLRVIDVAPTEQKKGWMDAAGLTGPVAKAKKNQRYVHPIPVLKDVSALGTSRASQREEVEFILEIPRQLLLSLPAGSVLYAIRAPDEAMNPAIEKGFIVVVDVSQRDPARLRDRMVVTRDREGVVISWLRRDMGLDVLMPIDLRHFTMKALDAKQGRTLVGAVVLWVGKPTEK